MTEENRKFAQWVRKKEGPKLAIYYRFIAISCAILTLAGGATSKNVLGASVIFGIMTIVTFMLWVLSSTMKTQPTIGWTVFEFLTWAFAAHGLLNVFATMSDVSQSLLGPNVHFEPDYIWRATVGYCLIMAVIPFSLVGSPRLQAILIGLSLVRYGASPSISRQPEFENAAFLAFVAALICAISSFIRLHSLLREYSAELEFDRLSSDAMPFLPTNLSAKFGEKVIKVEADSFSNLSVIFADIAGFTSLSKRISPGHLVEVLNEVFNEADKCAKSHGLERVKTIGDCYMAVAGGILSKTAGASQAVDFAEAYVKAFSRIPAIGQLGLSVRVGIHTGPAVGGMIGSQRLTYDYWGETVNLASRLEGCAPLNGFATSEATYLQVSGRFPEAHWDALEIRGVGLTKVFRHVF